MTLALALLSFRCRDYSLRYYSQFGAVLGTESALLGRQALLSIADWELAM